MDRIPDEQSSYLNDMSLKQVKSFGVDKFKLLLVRMCTSCNKPGYPRMAQPDEKDNASKLVKFNMTARKSCLSYLMALGERLHLERSLHSVPYLRTIMIFPGESLSSPNSYQETEFFGSSPEFGENTYLYGL